jgi:hypothetical protein
MPVDKDIRRKVLRAWSTSLILSATVFIILDLINHHSIGMWFTPLGLVMLAGWSIILAGAAIVRVVDRGLSTGLAVGALGVSLFAAALIYLR